jgi:hypothetical protein
MPSRRRLPTETASAAAERILRTKPSAHRILSSGDVRGYHTNRRWWVRRGMLVLMLFLAAGPINYGLYVALVKHGVVTPSAVVGQGLELGAQPLLLTAGQIGCSSLLSETTLVGCDRLVQLCLGKLALSELAAWWMLWVLPISLAIVYALSPGPVWWGFRLFAIEFMAAVYAVMELLYAPLIWLVDRSRTAREFYEGYYDVMEWID